MDVWFVGVLGKKSGFRILVGTEPDLWVEFYDEECRRLPLLTLNIFSLEAEALDFARALEANSSMREWVVQRNPHFVDISLNWRSHLEDSVIYLRHRVAELEAEQKRLKSTIAKIREEQDPPDDIGGALCRNWPIPPTRTPGYRQPIPQA